MWVIMALTCLLRPRPEKQLHKIIRGANVRDRTKVRSEAEFAA